MDNLAYLHLVLARQEGKPETPKPEKLGASWDKAAWDEIFEPKPTQSVVTTKIPQEHCNHD